MGVADMPEIKCNVESCHFNREGDLGRMCGAESIEVDHNFRADVGMEIGEMGDKPAARVSEQTCCRTFRPREAARS